ncbi:flavin reductase (NADPH)-like isoform X2 [Littorina saxatilis]|uniref:NAD(P)-binding domain-containing protein n=2 Tax=Littorina saxatilis TaxID=31220 RepID=A0AAN9AQ70_9CAEN
MKIAVFGATGPTGQQVVIQALAKEGTEVRALVRDPDKMTSLVEPHEKLHIHKVDLTKPEEFATHLHGVDVVLSCLGGRAGIFNPCSVYTDTIVPIVTAMRQANVKRLICITSWGAKDEPGLPWVISWFLKPTFLRNVLANMGEMEDYLAEKCSDINYTVVKPPGLSKDPVSEKEILTREGQFVENAANSIARADLARFMIACLDTEDFNHKLVAVGVPK